MGSRDKQKRKHKKPKKDKGERQEESNQLNENQQEEIDPQETEIEQDLPRKKKRKNKKNKGESQEEYDQLNEVQRETSPQETEIEQDLPRKQKRKHKNREERHDVSEQLNEGQKVAEVEQDLPHQRELVDDDSDVEDKPKRKKKKKPILPVDNDNTGPKKGQKSIRQMKREKFAQRQAEAQAVVKDQHKSDCLNYLSQWKHNRQNWKFMKAKQIWLCKNKFSLSLMPDALWPTLLEYFDSTQGNIRKILVEDANKIIKQLDDWTESQSKENNDGDAEESEVTKPDESVYKRARDLIQRLE